MVRHEVMVDGRAIGNVQETATGWDGETEHGVYVAADASGASFVSEDEATAAVVRQWHEAEAGPDDCPSEIN